jgi:hypothetical protein
MKHTALPIISQHADDFYISLALTINYLGLLVGLYP